MFPLPDGSVARLGRGYVRDIALSPDGDLLAAASSPDLLWWYDVIEPSFLTLWEVGTPVESIAFSDCGQWIATGGSGSIKVWDVLSRSCLMELARTEKGGNDLIVFSPNRRYLAVCGHFRYKKDFFSVEVYSLPETPQVNNGLVHLESTYTYAGNSPLAFSSNSTLLAFGAPTGAPLPFHAEGYPIRDENRSLVASNIAVCDVKIGQHLTTLSGFKDVGPVCFSPDGRFVAASDDRGPIRVWSVPEDFSSAASPWHLHKVYQEKNNRNIYYCAMSYSPEGILRTVERAPDDTIIVQEPDQGKTLYKHAEQNVHHVSDFLSGTCLAFAGDYKLHLWALGEDEPTCLSQMHAFPPHSLHFSQDGMTLIAMHRSDGIFSWDVKHPDQPPCVFNPAGKNLDSNASDTTYFSVDLSPEGKQFVTSGSENILYLWELGIDKPIAVFTVQEEVSQATFSPTANLVVCRDESGKIYMWDVPIKEERDTYYTGVEVGNYDLTFSPNGTYLACSPYHLYDVVRRKPVDSFTSKMVQFQAFSPDSNHIWNDGGSDDEITLWNIRSCKKILSLHKSGMWSEKHVSSFALSVCGRYIACSPRTQEKDISLDIWDIHKGTAPIATFKVPCLYAGDTLTLAFSPDSTILASGSCDGTILLWDMKPYLSI